MNRRRQADREWVEWVDNSMPVTQSPFERDDIWMVDRPDKGTCLYAAASFGGMELTAMMRDEDFEARITLSLDKTEMRRLHDFLSSKLKVPEDADAIEAKAARDDRKAAGRSENQ